MFEAYRPDRDRFAADPRDFVRFSLQPDGTKIARDHAEVEGFDEWAIPGPRAAIHKPDFEDRVRRVSCADELRRRAGRRQGLNRKLRGVVRVR